MVELSIDGGTFKASAEVPVVPLLSCLSLSVSSHLSTYSLCLQVIHSLMEKYLLISNPLV